MPHVITASHRIAPGLLYELTYDGDGVINRVLSIAHNGGSGDMLTDWSDDYEMVFPYYNSQVICVPLKPNLVLAGQVNGKVFTAISPNNGQTWDITLSLPTDCTLVGFGFDRNVPSRGWMIVHEWRVTDAVRTALSATIGISGQHSPGDLVASYCTYNATTRPIILYTTTDGGLSWSLLAILGYLDLKAPTRITARVTGDIPYRDLAVVTDRINWPRSTSSWRDLSSFCSWSIYDMLLRFTDAAPTGSAAPPYAGGWVDQLYEDGSYHDTVWIGCDTSLQRDIATSLFATPDLRYGGLPQHHILPSGDGTFVYACYSYTWRDASFIFSEGYGQVMPLCPISTAPSARAATFIKHEISKVTTGAGVSTITIAEDISKGWDYGFRIDPTDTNRIFVFSSYNYFGYVLFDAATLTWITQPWDPVHDTVHDIWVTPTGRVLVSVEMQGGDIRIYRTDDRGDTWTYTTIAIGTSSASYLFAQGKDGTLYIIDGGGGIVWFCVDDGVTWDYTAQILPVAETPMSLSAP